MNTQEEFDALESEWRDRLRGCSLVIEANVDSAKAVKAFTVLGRSFRNYETQSSRSRLMQEYRAALTIGLCAVGARGYSDGVFWPTVSEAFGSELTPSDQSELATAFRDALSLFGLSRFTTPLKYVGEILMHAGVPIKSLASFARLLQKHDALFPGLNGNQFTAWTRSLSRELAITHGFDVPTWRFIQEGGEIAEDFVDRCLSLLGATSGAVLDDEVASGLPVAVVAELRRLVESGELVLEPSKRRRRDEDLNPHLVFGPSRGIQVRLPALELITESAIGWRIITEGRSARVDVPAPWPGDPVIAKFQTIGIPAKKVLVAVQPSDQSWTLELVDVEDPLLIFDSDLGLLIPARNTLPQSTVWLVFANQEEKSLEACIEADAPVKIVSKVEAPYGWNGWTFVEVDLSHVSRLKLSGSERWRYVSTVTKPSLSNITLLEQIVTADGRLVSTTRPTVTLPSRPAEAVEGVSWLVHIEDEHGSVIASKTFESTMLPLEVDPWPQKPAALLGEFLVVVRGPLGRGMRQRIAVAEGVKFSATKPFRLMSEVGLGLDAVEYSLTGPEASTVASVQRTLSSSEQSDSFVLKSETANLSLVARVPSMSVTLSGPSDSKLSVSPLSIDREDLSGLTLSVSLPSRECGDLVAISAGQRLQTIRSSPGIRTSQVFNLAQLADTFAKEGTAELLISVDGRRIPIGHVRPKRLAESITVDASGLLEIHGANATHNLSCAIYPRFAPWRKPYVFNFVDGLSIVELTEDVLAEGAGTVMVRIEDPWVPEPWPSLPDQFGPNSFRVELGDFDDVARGAEKGFRNWMARRGECPSSAESLPLALEVYSLLRKVALAAELPSMLTELIAAVRMNREMVVEAVLETDLEARDLMRLFVEGEVFTVPGESWSSTPLLWTYSVGLGIIADSDQMITHERPLFINSLSTFAGKAGVAIVEDGVDALASIGRFGPNERAMGAWPRERVNELWDIASPLPGRLLDKDPRASAAKELFDARDYKAIKLIAAQSHRILTKTRAMLVTEIGPDAVKPLTSRQSDNGWTDLPAISLAFALCARLAARGSSAAQSLFHVLREHYAELANVAPTITEQDIALAELWVTYWRKDDDA